MKAYKDAHQFTFNGEEYGLIIQRLKVLAQPVGAYTDWLLDDNLNLRKGEVTVRQGKGGKSRTVPLNTAARKALQAWMQVRLPFKGSCLWIGMENGRMSALSGRSVQRALVRQGRAAGLEHLTPHVLRHTFAKNLIDAKVGLEKVAALLGHSNLNTTRIYVTPNQRDLEQAVEQISAD